MAHPGWYESDDARWLRRWLRNNLLVSLAIVGVLLTSRLQSGRPPGREGRSVPRVESLSAAPGPAPIRLANDPPPAETEWVELSADFSSPAGSQAQAAVRPQGWRRTVNGWENTSSWRLATRSLAEIVIAQQSREPKWMNQLLGGVRRVPPLAYALLQIAAIAGIVALSRGGQVAASSRAGRSRPNPNPTSGQTPCREEMADVPAPAQGNA